MEYYFVAESKNGKLIGQLRFDDIDRRFRAGEISGEYVATISRESSYSDLVKAGGSVWVSVADLVARHSQNQVPTPSNANDNPSVTWPWQMPTIKTEPISRAALTFVRIAGWAIAVISVIAGIVVLVNTPESTYIAGASGVRVIYLAMGWSQIIGGIITGVLLNVVAGIGNAVLDIWNAKQKL